MNEKTVTKHLVIAIARMKFILQQGSCEHMMKDVCQYARKRLDYQLNHGENLETLVFNIEEEFEEINIISDQLTGAYQLKTLEVNCANAFWESNHEGISALIHSSRRSLVSITLGFLEQYEGKSSEMMDKFTQQFSVSSRDMAELRNFSIKIDYGKQQISELLKSIGANISKLETLKIESYNQSKELLLICQIFKNNKQTLREFSLKIYDQQGSKQDLTQFFQVIQELDCLESLQVIFLGEEAVNLKSLSTAGWRNVSSLKALKSLSIGFILKNAIIKDWKPMLKGLKSLNFLQELSFNFNQTEVSNEDIASIISRQQKSLTKLAVYLNNTEESGQFQKISEEIKKIFCLTALTLNLKDISFKKKKGAFGLFDFLLQLPNLVFLEIGLVESEFSGAWLKHFCVILGKCHKLEHLRLKLGCYYISDDVYNSMRLSLLQCKELVSLQLSYSLGKLWDGEMFLRQLPRLVAVNAI